MPRAGFVYIMTNSRKSVLYTGVTSDLLSRVSQHKSKGFEGFTKRYQADRLVYFKEFGDVQDAIAEEKRIKGGSRAAKVALIEQLNPGWKDLSEEWL
jgi:putative endonuclease